MDEVSGLLPRPGTACSRAAAWSSTTTSRDLPLVAPPHGEAGSQCVLILPWNLPEAELVYLCTPGLSIDRPWGQGYLTTVFLWSFRKDTEVARLGRVFLNSLLAGKPGGT